MDCRTKPKYQVLQEFNDVLHKHNPMLLQQDNEFEYETEALSILSRFTEAAIQLADDATVVEQVASSIVKQTFEFWFENIDNIDMKLITEELVNVYRNSFEIDEQPKKQMSVTTVTIGD